MRRTYTSITVNGQTYGSVDEMPPAVRATYDRLLGQLTADRDGNGVPDAFESDTVDGTDVVHMTTTHSEVYDIDGRRYTGLDEMPPEVRRLVTSIRRTGGAPAGLSTGSATFRGRGGRGGQTAGDGFHIRLSGTALAWLALGLVLAALWLAWAMRSN